MILSSDRDLTGSSLAPLIRLFPGESVLASYTPPGDDARFAYVAAAWTVATEWWIGSQCQMRSRRRHCQGVRRCAVYWVFPILQHLVDLLIGFSSGRLHARRGAVKCTRVPAEPCDTVFQARSPNIVSHAARSWIRQLRFVLILLSCGLPPRLRDVFELAPYSAHPPATSSTRVRTYIG